jgi:Chaperone of endosialidase
MYINVYLFIYIMSGGTFGTNWLDLASTSNRCNRMYVQGFMDISGGNLIVRNNNLYLTQGDASINGNLILGRDASLNQRLFVGSDVSFGGNLFIAKNVGLGVSGSFGVYDVCNNAQMVLDVSGGVNLRGPVMGGVTLPDQSVLMTAAPPLDISNNFGTVWRQVISLPNAVWRGSSMSSNGQYQTACIYNNSSGGYIYTSNNYGVTWNSITSTGAKNFNTVSVSANGQYQAAVADGDYIYTSNNYGVTWTAVTSAGIKNWYSIAISATGQYQIAGVYNSATDTIYTSNNYGVTWTQITSISGKWIKCVSISATGQYQSACAFVNASTGDYIYTSNNYGVTWRQDTSVGSAVGWQSIAMSANGQYQTACVYGTGSGGYIYTSSNYGITWRQDTSVGSAKTWSAISMTANGQFQTAGVYNSTSGGYLYVSTNYGITWKQATSDANRQWCSISISANGQYIIAVASYSYLYQSITPYNDLVVQNRFVSYGDASFNKNISIKGSNVLEFGDDQTKALDAGKIGYGTWDPGYLCIVGAGTSLASRNVKISDHLLVWGTTTSSGGINIPGANVINFGSDQTKETNAGKIGYGTFDAGALCIVGAGTATRTVKMWDNVTVNNNLTVGSSIGCNYISITNGAQCATFYNNSNSSTGDVVAISKNNGNTNYCMFWDNNGGSSNGNFVYIENSGQQVGTIRSTNTSSVSYNTASDYRLKQNITELTNAEYIIEHLKPVSFEFKSEPDNRVEGFIAHEVQEFIPWCVSGDKDAVNANGKPEYQGIDTGYMIPYIVKMLQIQNKRISDLQLENSNLKQQFSDLQQEVSELKQLIINK